MAKIYLKTIIMFTILILIFSIVNTTLYYFDVINTNISHILSYIFLVISSISSGFYIGKNTSNKAYLKGLIIGLIIAIILVLLKLIIRSSFSILSILYLLSIIVFSVIGSIISNKNKEK